jgi:hypothetical protein
MIFLYTCEGNKKMDIGSSIDPYQNHYYVNAPVKNKYTKSIEAVQKVQNDAGKEKVSWLLFGSIHIKKAPHSGSERSA